MVADPHIILPIEVQLAIAHSGPKVRDALRIFFELDHRLSRIVGATTEMMLGQMRLAWWRETLSRPPADRPNGDAVLDAIGVHWTGYEHHLSDLVDGWEYMLAERLDVESAQSFAKGRASPFAAIAEMSESKYPRENSERVGRRWALLDAALHVPEGPERDLLLQLAKDTPSSSRFPRELRGIAVLDALAQRSLLKGGQPMMEGRTASLVATRAAIFGL